MRRYCLRSAAAYALIVAIFIFGVFSNKSLHLGGLLYVMLALFMGSMAYFIYASYTEVLKRKKKLLEESAGDLLPHVRYARSSLVLVCVAAAFLPIAILFDTLLLLIGPLMLLVLMFFVHSFISLGYYITPVENMLEEQEDQEEQEESDTSTDQLAYGDQQDAVADGQADLSFFSQKRMKEIGAALENGVMTECIKTAMSPYIRLLPTWVARRMNLPNTSIFLSIPTSVHGSAISALMRRFA